MNNIDGSSKWYKSDIKDWISHSDKTVDVSAISARLDRSHDHLTIEYSNFADKSTFINDEISPGDEIFITGLFKHHIGEDKNIPIIRVGNLAAMNEVNVTTQLGNIDAYLAEVRSIGGLSGSPVFLNLGTTRSIGGKIVTAKKDIIYFLGLIHGHFDDLISNADKEVSRINTGIAMIVPSQKVVELIEQIEKEPDK